jgi:hypothetical protein
MTPGAAYKRSMNSAATGLVRGDSSRSRAGDEPHLNDADATRAAHRPPAAAAGVNTTKIGA